MGSVRRLAALGLLGLASVAVAAAATTLVLDTVTTADGPRSYLLARPDRPRPGPRPLVLVLHGHAGSAAQALGLAGYASPLAQWLAVADRARLLVAALDGARGSDGRRGWHDCRRDAPENPRTDDVAFAAAVVRRLVDAGAADPARVYVMGMSNGGMMAHRLALEMQPPPAAFAAVAAGMAADSECGPARRPVSALLINGSADPLVPYRGGGVGLMRKNRGQVVPVADAVDFWRRADGLDGPGRSQVLAHREADDPTRAEVTWWGSDPRGLQVELVSVADGGHIEPSLVQRYRPVYERLAGHQNHDLEAVEEAWRFFQDKRAEP